MTQKALSRFERKGMSLIQLLRKFPDGATAERWFEEQRRDKSGRYPYVNEFATRHNLHLQDTKSIMTETVVRMISKRLTYADPVAGR